MANKYLEKEQKFFALVDEAPFRVTREVPAIHSKQVVIDPNGKPKSIAVFDGLVYDPAYQQLAFVEVTNGRGNNPHKAGQFLVAEMVGLPNLTLVTGEILKATEAIDDPIERYWFLRNIFAWAQPQSVLKTCLPNSYGLGESFQKLSAEGFFAS